jgi:hypothetical protein
VLVINYHTLTWTSSAAVFANGASANTSLKITFDFSADTIAVTQDGSTIAGTITAGSITNVEAGFSVSTNFYIGTSNDNGTPFSNPDAISIFYFYVSTLQAAQASAISSYVLNKPPTIALAVQEQDNTNYDAPHDIEKLTRLSSESLISCKGDPSLTTQDGGFVGVDDHTNTADLSITRSYVHQTDQVDGETVLIISSTRAFHFVASSALLFDTSNPAALTLVRSVSYTASVINGAVRKGNYVFGAAKDGKVHVFDISTIDSFTLTGSHDAGAGAEGLGSAHDVDFIDDEYLMVCNNSASAGGKYFGIYKAFNASSLITPSSWTQASSLGTAGLEGANRLRKITSTIGVITMNSTGNGAAKVDYSNLASPSITDFIALNDACAGLDTYRDKYAFVANGVRVRLIDVISQANIVLKGGYSNNTTFDATGNTNFHDCWWSLNTTDFKIYLTMTCQRDNRIALFRINRF